jgi:hypothetical protein
MDAHRVAADATDLDGLVSRMTAALEEVGIFVGAEIDGDTVVISGEVDSVENRDAAMDVARATLGRAGLRLVDAIDIMEISPDSVYDPSPRLSASGYRESDAAGAGDQQDRGAMEIDPDFIDDIGTTDPQIAAAEGVPYYPPTDPVVRPADNPQELDMLNGFAPSAMDDRASGDGPRNDEELVAEIEQALRDDASTMDVADGIAVGVRDGVVLLVGDVPTLEDAENAEAVAGMVAGVVEVREELRIDSIRDRSSRSE